MTGPGQPPDGAPAVPAYLVETYWWAYVSPRAVAFFDRLWIVNLILWGNFGRLCEAALEALGPRLPGRTLQVACVYGDLTHRITERLGTDDRLDVVDVLPVQLARLAGKVGHDPRVRLHLADSRAIGGPDHSYDRALVYFLLHEQPAEVRAATLREVQRLVRPGGTIVIVDYDRPHPLHPLRPFMRTLLRHLEPFALDLWQHEIEHWLPSLQALRLSKQRYFGGLYQRLVYRA